MYSIYNTNAAIKEIQRMLGVNQTGHYDAKTRDAVREIQRAYELTETGETDYKTFRAISDNHQREKLKKSNCHYLNSEYPYIYADIGENILLINSALSRVLKNYDYEGVYPHGSFFGTETVNGIRFLRKVFLLNGDDSLDSALMNRIMLELDAIEIKSLHKY